MFEERLPQLAPPGTPTPGRLSPAATELKRAIHQTIDAVSQELERFHFNKAVALIRELSNRVEAVRCRRSGGARRCCARRWRPWSCCSGPWCRTSPRSCGSVLAMRTLLADAAWPQADPAWLAEDRVTIAVQVNGRLRATISLPRGSDRATTEAAALAESNVRRGIEGKPLRRVVVVPDKVVNVVV